MDKEPITLNGLNRLEEELVFLKEKKRPEIVAAISEARSHGDLKENAEYHAAKEEQSHNEGRITEINDIIARANVIDVTKLNNDGKVIFGSTVSLENLDNGEKISYKIREHISVKIPILFIIGQKETEDKTVTIREIGNNEQVTLSLEDAVSQIKDRAVPPDFFA